MKQEHATIEEIIDYLHGELAPEDDAALYVHMESCTSCTAQYNEQARLSEALHAYGKATENELPQGVVARIWDAAAKEHARPSWIEGLAALLRPAVALPIAAVLIAAIIFAPRLLERSAGSIDVAYYMQDHAALTNAVPFHEGSVEPETLQSDLPATDQHWVATTGASLVAANR